MTRKNESQDQQQEQQDQAAKEQQEREQAQREQGEQKQQEREQSDTGEGRLGEVEGQDTGGGGASPTVQAEAARGAGGEVEDPNAIPPGEVAERLDIGGADIQYLPSESSDADVEAADVRLTEEEKAEGNTLGQTTNPDDDKDSGQHA